MNPMFIGFNQQDSHEAFTTIVDVLNEDLNEIKKKPYLENPSDDEQISDDEKFKTFWKNFLSRNQSVIVDNMTGIYKSVVTCNKCHHISTTFQNFTNITLPVVT